MLNKYTPPKIGFFILSLIAIHYGQNTHWINYTCGTIINDIAEYNNCLWIIPEKGGLVKIDNNTQDTIFYNSANSRLPTLDLKKLCIDSSGNVWIIPSNCKYELIKFNGTDFVFPLIPAPVEELTSMTVDRQNNLWLGTASCGLGRYNGTSWAFFDTSNSDLPFSTINAIAVDNNGIKWLGMVPNKWGGNVHGLVKLDGTHTQLYTSSNSDLPDNAINAITVDYDNAIWIGMKTGGLARFHQSLWTLFNTTNSAIPDNNILAIAVDPQKNKWIGTGDQGIAAWDESKWSVYNSSNSPLPNNHISNLTTDSNGNIFIGTSHYLASFDGTNWDICNPANSGLPHHEIRVLEIDRAGNKWIGVAGQDGQGEGLIKFDGTSWSVYNTNNSHIPFDIVTHIACDSDNNIWMVADTNGLIKYDGKNWTLFNEQNSDLPHNYINALAIDKNNVKWLGISSLLRDSDSLADGLVKFDNNNWTFYNCTNSILPDKNKISSITFANDNTAWMVWWYLYVGFYGGVISVNGTNWNDYDLPDSHKPSRSHNSITSDSQNKIWIAMSKGLSSCQNAQWQIYLTENSGLPSNSISVVKSDQANTKWIGTSDRGLVKYKGSDWKTYLVENSGIGDDKITDLEVDQEGNKWLGTTCDLTYMGMDPVESKKPFNQISKNTYDLHAQQNYGSVIVSYSIKSSGNITLALFDLQGRLIKKLENGTKKAGYHTVNADLSRYARGIYVLRLESVKKKLTSQKIFIVR